MGEDRTGGDTHLETGGKGGGGGGVRRRPIYRTRVMAWIVYQSRLRRWILNNEVGGRGGRRESGIIRDLSTKPRKVGERAAREEGGKGKCLFGNHFRRPRSGRTDGRSSSLGSTGVGGGGSRAIRKRIPPCRLSYLHLHLLSCGTLLLNICWQISQSLRISVNNIC